MLEQIGALPPTVLADVGRGVSSGWSSAWASKSAEAAGCRMIARCSESVLVLGALPAARLKEGKMSGGPPPHWSREFLKPVNFVTTVFGVLGVIGVVFGFYAYHRTANRPELSWSSLRQIVFDQQNATSAITVLDAQGRKISENMYASQITVWNSGNQRFDNVDDSTLIREPLTFRLTGAGHIVSATITNTLNDIAGGWSISANQQTAVMAWRHFDPGAAARVLILYTGDGASGVKLEIAVAGSSVMVDNSPREELTRRPSQKFIYFIVISLIFISLILIVLEFRRMLRINKTLNIGVFSRVNSLTMLMLVIWVGALIYMYVLTVPAPPEF